MLNNNTALESKSEQLVSRIERIYASENFLRTLYKSLHLDNFKRNKYGYLWIKKGGDKLTLTFDMTLLAQILAMAITAVQKNEEGYDVFYGVCLTDVPMSENIRSKKNDISLQASIWVDIDIKGRVHVGDNYSTTVETAISFLPFEPSIIEEIIKNNLDTSITILTNFDFGKSPLTASIIEATTMCKIYDPKEYEKFKAKGILFHSLSEEIEKEGDKYIKCLEIAKKKGNVIQDLPKQLSELRYSYNVSKLIQISKDKPPSSEKNELILTLINETLERNESGKILSNVKNYELILQFDPVVGNCVGYDAFGYRITPLRTDLPWRQSSLVNFNEWNKLDDAALQNYLNRTYGNLNNEKIFKNVLQEIANKNSFHPVRDYLEILLPWDGIERAPRLFIELLGAKDCEYTKSITMHWLKAAVARIYYPGCKFDYCLVLKGAQGKGKSTILAKLGGKWFNDSIFDISGKEALENLQGNWIIEIGEMQATKRADNEAPKSFFQEQMINLDFHMEG